MLDSGLVSCIETRQFRAVGIAHANQTTVLEQFSVHSDRGAHYRWPGWLSRIADAKLILSMSRKGCSPDNAACEGFFARLKTELFYPRNWQSTSIEQFIQALDSNIRWYNEKRIKISLSALSPIEYRESLGFAA